MAYPTRRWECWGKAKEDRNKQWEECMSAKERGVPLFLGGTGNSTVLVGIGEFAYLPGEPYAAEICRYPDLARRVAEAVEQRGYGSDLCGYLRHYWGSAFIRETPWGPFPEPDFVIEGHHCDSHGQWFRRIAEEFNRPYFVVEHPERACYNKITDRQIEYVVAQYQEMIEWLEKQTGKPYDDEALVKAVVNTRKTCALWAEILEMNQTVPAPMDMKSMFTLSNPAVRERFTDGTVAFYYALRDEMKQRVQDGIAALANEKARLLHDNLPPWFALHIFHFMEQFGAVCVASQYQFHWGLWEYDQEGKFHARPVAEVEKEPRPKNREEALRLMCSEAGVGGMMGDSGVPINNQLYDDWKCNGAIFHLNRGCEGWTRGKMESRTALQRRSVPTMLYEGNGSDRRDFNEGQVLSRIQAFFESMGLTREAV